MGIKEMQVLEVPPMERLSWFLWGLSKQRQKDLKIRWGRTGCRKFRSFPFGKNLVQNSPCRKQNWRTQFSLASSLQNRCWSSPSLLPATWGVGVVSLACQAISLWAQPAWSWANQVKLVQILKAPQLWPSHPRPVWPQMAKMGHTSDKKFKLLKMVMWVVLNLLTNEKTGT